MHRSEQSDRMGPALSSPTDDRPRFNALFLELTDVLNALDGCGGLSPNWLEVVMKPFVQLILSL